MLLGKRTVYKIGTHDPVIKNDDGAGLWNSKVPTPDMIILKNKILEHLPHAYLLIGDDAVKHMFHYLNCTGSNYTIDLEGMIEEVQSAKDGYNEELNDAKRFVESLPAGTHHITTDQVSSYYNSKEQSRNWYYATGGYSAWIKGKAEVGENGGKREFMFEYEYKFKDRYNWDKGKKVRIFGVPVSDDAMAKFHLQGLAKEFDMNGSVKKNIFWNNSPSISI